jgi:Pyridoxamine 5'-phosphate oxidase
MSADRDHDRERMPLSAEAIAGSDAVFQPGDDQMRSDGAVLPWGEARTVLTEARFYWLATVRPESTPHVRPVLAVWLGGSLFSTTNPTARKARNLELNQSCSVTARSDELDVVVEGVAARRTDRNTLEEVANIYRSKYGWPVTLRDGAFDAPYGAPTSGPPPYLVYEIAPSVVFGFGTDEAFGPRSTRWRF